MEMNWFALELKVKPSIIDLSENLNTANDN